LVLCDSTGTDNPDNVLKVHALVKNLRVFNRGLTSEERLILSKEQ